MPRSSQRLGTCASRLRPVMPSAMLKTTSTLDVMSARGNSAVASSGTTDVPVALDGLGDGLDGLGRVVLGLAVVAGVRVDALHVEGEADAQAGAASPRGGRGLLASSSGERARGARRPTRRTASTMAS